MRLPYFVRIVPRATLLLLLLGAAVPAWSAGLPAFDRMTLLEAKGETSAGVSLGDVDGDGILDIVLAKVAKALGVEDDAPRPDYTASPNDNVIIEGIAANPTSLGWVGFAFVEVNEGASFTPEEMRAHCKGVLADYKIPKHLAVVPALPRTSTAKIQRSALAGLAQAELARRRAAQPA